MDYEDLHNAIRTRVQLIVETGQSVAVRFENEPQPDSTGLQVESFINHRAHEKRMVGGIAHHYRKTAELELTVSNRMEEGDQQILELVDAVRGSFRNQTVDEVKWITPYIEPMARDGDRWNIKLLCPLTHDDRVVPSALTSLAVDITGFETMANATRTRFKELVEDTVLPGLILYDNAPFTPDPNSIWSSLTFSPGLDAIVEGGDPHRTRVTGQGNVMIFLPINEGDQAALSVADTIVDAFRSISEAGITYRTPFVRPIGRAGPWWQVNVTLPFYSDFVA